ncbi:uncharacterized protein si:ch211-171b20.3 [Anabas testudineus]|uniref:uncharacterized protein si:ch211-171b20.3 n=1 Tax=Anabas testudineus TaxID=64144 RepID=UPI000E457A08|nr:uncharacterized protein si:ch211-171b20.3 [Anabas testudineus]
MMAFQVNAKILISEGGSSNSQRGPDAAGDPTYRSFGMRSGGGQACFSQNNHIRRKFPVIQPLSKSRDGRALISDFVVGGSPFLARDDKLQTKNSDLVKDIYGRHFEFDKKCARLERARTVIPPLPRDYNVHRPGSLYPFCFSKELSHSHAVQPFTLGYPERYELNTNPAILFPPTLVLNGRNTFSVENCKLSRPKVNYPTYNVLTVKDNQKTSCHTDQSYPDPMIRASRSFIHRISELSSLEGETVRQEKLKKMRKARKPPS